MQDDHPDILRIERDFERLRRFLARAAWPLSRAVAITRFALALPGSLQGRSYYLTELRADARDALSLPFDEIPDPQLRELLQRAAALFESDPPPTSSPPACADRAPGLSASPNQACLLVPLVQALPEMEAGAIGPAAVGMLAPLAVVPQVLPRRGPRFAWHNRHASSPVGDLRSLRDVSADAFLAAGEALAVAEARARLQGRAARWLGRVRGRATGPIRRLGFRLSLPEKTTPVAGDSIGLALTVAFAGAMQGLQRGGRGFRPRGDVAWTGRVLPSGQVLGVDARSLAAKIRAAYFGGARTLVVPAGMGSDARALSAAAGCPLAIEEIAHVAEAVEHPELTETWPLPSHLFEACTHRRLRRWLGAAALLLSAGLLAYHVPREPRRLTVTEHGTTLRVHYQGLWWSRALTLPTGALYAELVDDLDGDRPGARRLVCATGRGNIVSAPGQLLVFDPVRWRTVWADTLRTSGLPRESRNLYADGLYSSKIAAAGDFDGDGRTEIILIAAFNPHADAFLWFYDGLRGRSSGLYHDGHLEHLIVDDLDLDGRPEIVTAGLHRPTRGISILALHLDQLRACEDEGMSEALPPAAPWDPLRQPCLFHLVTPVIPGLEAMDGRRELGSIGTCALDVIHVPEGPRRISFAINVQNSRPLLNDYILTCDERGCPIELTAATPLRDRAAEMLRLGLTRIDFGSDSLLAAWRATFRTRPYVQNDWPASGDAAVPDGATRSAAGEASSHAAGAR